MRESNTSFLLAWNIRGAYEESIDTRLWFLWARFYLHGGKEKRRSGWWGEEERKDRERQRVAIRQENRSSGQSPSSKSCRPDCWQILSTRTYSYAAAARRAEGMPLYANEKAGEGWPQPRPEFRDRFADMNAPLEAGCRCHYRCDRWRMNY